MLRWKPPPQRTKPPPQQWKYGIEIGIWEARWNILMEYPKSGIKMSEVAETLLT